MASQVKTSIYGGSSESVTNIDSQFSFLDQSKLYKMKRLMDQNCLGKQKAEVDDLLAYLDKFEEEINQIGQNSQKHKKATPLIRIEQSTDEDKEKEKKTSLGRAISIRSDNRMAKSQLGCSQVASIDP